jgi:large subunit ribosomal protein L15
MKMKKRRREFMIKVKKRKKSTRFRGSHSHKRGFKKKARGSGHRGGFGMAGTGKRANHRKSLVINLYGNDYFGKDKTLRKGKIKPKLISVNLYQIVNNLKDYIKKNLAKQNKNEIELNLKGYKILGEGDIGSLKLKITASSASKSAMEKIKSAGGELIISK